MVSNLRVSVSEQYTPQLGRFGELQKVATIKARPRCGGSAVRWPSRASTPNPTRSTPEGELVQHPCARRRGFSARVPATSRWTCGRATARGPHPRPAPRPRRRRPPLTECGRSTLHPAPTPRNGREGPHLPRPPIERRRPAHPSGANNRTHKQGRLAGEPRAEAGRGDRQRGARRRAPRVVELGEVEGEGHVVEI